MDWPADGKPSDLEDLVQPICAAIKFAYRLRRQNHHQDIPWWGPDIGGAEAAHAPRAKCQLRAKNLHQSLDEQGRDALTEIIGLAVRLGIEQGRRIVQNSPEYRTLCLLTQLHQEDPDPC